MDDEEADVEAHWYCPCGLTRQVMSMEIALRMEPTFACQFCRSVVSPVKESEELLHHEVDNGGGC